ncbi:hypothetical protein P3X46_032608 [Hevea brasiliensis]|uniref:Peptidyl serine alpha-galactosyltransferase n=1 Tax=Hevea brasiliensis TaxID=3981 RepID=A0ABQ9KGQ4_HEVBR|nr:hypothetical protein P3X46_032608 [Hevea brasiliensis]
MAKFTVLIWFLLGLCIDVVSGVETGQEAPFRIHTLFKKAGQPGPITRLMGCTEDEKKKYKRLHLALIVEVPSMSKQYPVINKPAGVVHWLQHSEDADNVDWVVILDFGLQHRINDNLMIYPGYTPREGVQPILLHYGLPFSLGNWSFSKLEHHEDDIVYDCGRLFPEPPYPRGSRTFAELTRPKLGIPDSIKTEKTHPKIHTIFSTECTTYFDWQTVGLIHGFHLSGEPGNITLLSCADEDLKQYTGYDLAPTHYVPSMSQHPLRGDWYPAINKPAAVLHWLNHTNIDAEFIVILDANMVMRGPITPWEFKAACGHPVSTPYERPSKICYAILLWLHKTEKVRADKAHYATNITGDIYESGWISEMYGYSFGAAELQLRHLISREILIYPGYVPESGVKYRVFHYGLEFKDGNWSFDKANWRDTDLINKCWTKFPDPPDPSTLNWTDEDILERDLLTLLMHHKKRNCPDPRSLSNSNSDTAKEVVSSRKFGRIDGSNAVRSNPLSIKHSQESSLHAANDGLFGFLRFRVIILWANSGLGFVAVMFMVFLGRKNKGTKGQKIIIFGILGH